MAFDALDSLLRDQQYAIAKRSNFDLPFGGTTEAEFDFLAKNGAVNTMAPNFLSFMAGISATNLATQANRQQQFEQFGKLRDMNSALDQRRAVTRNTLLEGDKAEELMPYVAPQAQANLTNTLTGIDAARENTYGQYLQNEFYPETIRSQNAYRDAQYEGQDLQNRYYPETIQSQNANRNAQTDQQRFINNNLQGREDLYTRSQNAQINQTQAQTDNTKIINDLNRFKVNTAQELHNLEVKLKNNQISREDYEAQKAQAAMKYFEANQQLEAAYKQSQTDANNALAQERRNGNGGGWWYPTMETNNPTPTQQPQIPPQSGLGTNASQTQDIVKSALIKQAQGVSLSPSEIALLQGMNLLVGGY